MYIFYLCSCNVDIINLIVRNVRLQITSLTDKLTDSYLSFSYYAVYLGCVDGVLCTVEEDVLDVTVDVSSISMSLSHKLCNVKVTVF